MKDLRKDSILVCPRNDEESLTILQIAEALGLSVVESAQPHGAKLDREPDLIGCLQETNPDARTLVIVELPGERTEKELQDLGYEIVIIDHHTYDDLDRMKPQSSLEQFLAVYDVDDMLLRALGFDPEMVAAVAAIDRGFLWELDNFGWSEAKKTKARKYYRSLTMELGSARREKEEAAAKEAWAQREERDGLIIIRSEADDISVRDPISFIVADEIGKPTQLLIIQGHRRMYVQESDSVARLKEAFGGFTFGQNRCWGILKEDGTLPSVEEVVGVILGTS